MSRPFSSAPSTNLPPAPNHVGAIGIDAMSLHPDWLVWHSFPV